MKGDAFALAGLGGFNAHGAGFLTAASKHHWIPELVTATSGQILVVADWLRGKCLRKDLIDGQRESNPLATLETALLGYPGVFAPAYTEIIQRFWTLPSITDGWLDFIADRFLPAQTYRSTRDHTFFEETAQTLNEARINGNLIGILFNAYDFATGKAVLYGNKRAQELLPKQSKMGPSRAHRDVRYAKTGLQETEVWPITSQALKAALWLSLYGFDQLPDGKMDGAYHRSCLVSELHEFSRVFIARPLANSWIGKRPGNWFEVQDWQCEMWFSVGYKAEVDALRMINQLVRDNHLRGPFKEVQLYEIEPDTPAGYFHYFVERDVVFDRAFDQADRVFAELKGGPAQPAVRAAE